MFLCILFYFTTYNKAIYQKKQHHSIFSRGLFSCLKWGTISRSIPGGVRPNARSRKGVLQGGRQINIEVFINNGHSIIPSDFPIINHFRCPRTAPDSGRSFHPTPGLSDSRRSTPKSRFPRSIKKVQFWPG